MKIFDLPIILSHAVGLSIGTVYKTDNFKSVSDHDDSLADVTITTTFLVQFQESKWVASSVILLSSLGHMAQTHEL